MRLLIEPARPLIEPRASPPSVGRSVLFSRSGPSVFR